LFSELDATNCFLLIVAAMGIGLSKSGFPGIGMFHVIILASIFGARRMTGILLPMLIVGDLCAIWFFGNRAQWSHIRRMLPPTFIGIAGGWALMKVVSNDAQFKPLVGVIVLSLALLQMIRTWRPGWFEHVPHQRWFAWTLGLFAGITTMLANAAGPVMALYMIAVGLPKLELVGTSAWFFLVVNTAKLPFSFDLNLISTETLLINSIFAPAILPGMFLGRWLVHRISQKTFDSLSLVLTALASLRLMFVS
jgi:uncharacterized protein